MPAAFGVDQLDVDAQPVAAALHAAFERIADVELAAERFQVRPREWPIREIVNGIFYVMRAGCPWRLLPNDLPPWGTIYRWFAAWRDDGRFEKINHALVMADRERVGREAGPSAAIIDSQSVETTEAGGPRGYDAGKKINGRKRHALVDTDGRGLVLEPHPASVQDRDGGGALLRASRCTFPFIRRVFADSGYAGEKVARATLIAVEIVRKNPNQVGFAVKPQRWVVERFFAWIGRNRRLSKDFEATINSARAFLYAASIIRGGGLRRSLLIGRFLVGLRRMNKR